MVRLLDSGLEQLTLMVYKSGEAAKSALNMAFKGFMNGTDAMDDVRDLSDVISSMTVEIENKAFELIVKYQPVASDLRIINSYMKVAYDFERYGRYAWDISFTHKKLGALEECAVVSDLMSELVEKVSDMVGKSVKALKEHDAEMAKTLADTENEVDKLYFEYLEQLSKARTQNKCVMCNLLVSRYLERIADHTTYVGEAIVYIATGEKVSLR
jgi:phosphate transport system protein